MSLSISEHRITPVMKISPAIFESLFQSVSVIQYPCRFTPRKNEEIKMTRHRNPDIRKPVTIQDNLLLATAHTKDQNQHKLPKDMETWFKPETSALTWGKTVDVMYSFKSIYALGVWAYNFSSGNFEIKNNKLRYRPEDCLLWNGDLLLRIQDYDKYGLAQKLNNNEDMKYFARHYFSLGNLMPIWPGGNVPKGNQNNSFFDLPELYFQHHKTWFNVIKNGFDNVFFDDLFTDVGAVYDKGLEAFVNSINSEENYNKFLHHVVTVTRTREERIKKWMSDNNIVVKCSWDYPVDD